MRAEGLEPSRACAHRVLNPACLPIPSGPPAIFGVYEPARGARSLPATTAAKPGTRSYLPHRAPDEEPATGVYGHSPESGQGERQDHEGDRRPHPARLGWLDVDRDVRRVVEAPGPEAAQLRLVLALPRHRRLRVAVEPGPAAHRGGACDPAVARCADRRNRSVRIGFSDELV